MIDEETPADAQDEDGFDDVYGEAPPVDDHQLSTRPSDVTVEP
ncbi:hypothetical protein ACFY0F_23360 [Streptomyces sp. NPDC001544]